MSCPLRGDDLRHYQRKMLETIGESLKERGCSACSPVLLREWVRMAMLAAVEAGAVKPGEVFDLEVQRDKADPATEARRNAAATELARALIDEARKG